MNRKGKSEQARSAPLSPERRLLEKKVRAASRALLFEKLWPRIWLPLSVAGVFILLSALEVWQFLPPRAHLGLLWAFGIGFALSFVPLFAWRRPGREKSFQRLEQASGLDHRPVTAFNDTLPPESASLETRALWEAHRTRIALSLKKLRAGIPHARVDRYDPFALRAALVLMLTAVLFWAWPDLGSRLKAAFAVPEIPEGASFRIDAWISPPSYTRKEPFVLANGALSWGKESIAVPEGSILTVKINGSDAAGYRVSLSTDGNTERMQPVERSGDTYAEFTKRLEQSGTLSIGHGFSSGKSWALTIIADEAPSIAFTGPIEVSQRSVMLFKYKVDDDYGVASAEARVERVQPAPAKGEKSRDAPPQIGKPPVFPLTLPRVPVKSAESKTYKDLTAHPWAGLPVVITLVAKDEAGHEGSSAPRGMILPERKFTKPLAKAIIDQRRSLVENPSDTFRVASNLNALAVSAEDEGLAPDIYLSLRSAYWRLRGRPPIEEIESSVDQLWDAAIRIEDGNLSASERELRAAQDRLKEALERGAPQEEIQKLMGELRQALNRYLQALLEQQKRSGGDKAALPPNANMKTITPHDLQQLLNKIESLAKAGSQEAAAQMLNELRDILESLQTANRGGESDEQGGEQMQKLDRLTDLMRKQQQLLDQTFRAQQGQDNGQGEGGQRGQRSNGQRQGGNGQGHAGRPMSPSELRKGQNELLGQLNELLPGLGQGKEGDAIRRKMEEAGEAMGEASDALGQNELGEATEQESRALDNLRQGARAMAEQMMRQAGGMRGNSHANRDPLGRFHGNQLDSGDSVKVPDEITVQRAREILDELRKRLGQPSRPAIELDYLERLIKPY